MKIRFIFNPCSGKNRRRPWLVPVIREFIATHRLDAEVFPTVRPGHATQLAREALHAPFSKPRVPTHGRMVA